MKILIITEGGRDMGFGHIARCLSLFQAFKKRGIKPQFIINGDSSIKQILADNSYELLDWMKAKNRTTFLSYQTDIVIIDSYLANVSLYKELSRAAKLAVFFDDSMRLNYPKGIVLNSSILAEKLGYLRKRQEGYLLGVKYAPLRKEFWNAPENYIRPKVKRVLITIGGSDVKNLTPKIIAFLSKSFPSIYKTVFISKAFINWEKIEKMADARISVVCSPNTKTLKDIMLRSDIAISAGGQTLCELARLGIPTIAIAVVKNQIQHIDVWRKAGFAEYAGWWESEKLFDNIRRVMNILDDSLERRKKSVVGRCLIDGNGSLRTVDHLLKVIK